METESGQTMGICWHSMLYINLHTDKGGKMKKIYLCYLIAITGIVVATFTSINYSHHSHDEITTKKMSHQSFNKGHEKGHADTLQRKKLDAVPTLLIDSHASYKEVSETYDELKNNNTAVVEGKVTNLERIYEVRNIALTKGTIHVTKILNGSSHLLEQDIKVIFQGGKTSLKDLYAGMEHKAIAAGFQFEKRKNEIVNVVNPQSPIPEIGTTIIAGISQNRFNDDPEYNSYLKKNGLGNFDSWTISTPEYEMWIDRDKNHTFESNNPELQSSPNGRKYSNHISESDSFENKMDKLTEEINNAVSD